MKHKNLKYLKLLLNIPMVYFSKNIKPVQSILCAMKLFYLNTECICISKGKIIEFYNKSYEMFSSLKTHITVTHMSSIMMNKVEHLFLYSYYHQYVILNDGKKIFSGKIDIEEKVKFIIGDGKRIIIVYTSNIVKIIYIRKGVVIIDTFNDLKYYEILDIKFLNNRIIFLVKDVDQATTIYFYKERFELEEKKSSIKTKKLLGYKEQLFLLKEDKITLNFEGETVNLDFSNPFLLSSFETSNGIILAMKNGEIYILNPNDKNIKFIGKVKTTVNYIIPLKNNRYLFVSTFGPTMIVTVEPFEIISKYDNSSYIRNININKKIHFLSGASNNSSIDTFSYGIPIEIEREIKLSETIKKFWIYKDFIIAVYTDCSIIYDKDLNIQDKLEEILNLHIYNDCCYFNTESKLYRFIKDGNITHITLKSSILSSFYKENVIFYTEESTIELYSLNRLEIIYTKPCKYQISFICLNEYTVISTYYNELIIFDRDFNEKKFTLETLFSGFYLDNKILGSTLDGRIMVFDIITQETNILCFTEPLTTINRIGDEYMILGESPSFISEDLNLYPLFLKNISYSFYNKDLYISKKNFIYKIKKEENPKYKINSKPLKKEGMFMINLHNINRTFMAHSIVKKILNYNETNIKERTAKIDSKFTLYFNSKKIKSKIIENTIPMAGKEIKELIVVGYNCTKENKGIISLLSPQNLDTIYETHLDKLILSLETQNDYIAVGTASSILLYKLQGNVLVRLSKSDTQIYPIDLHFKDNTIFVSDFVKCFSIYKIDLEINDLIEEKRALNNKSYKSLYYNNKILSINKDKIYITKEDIQLYTEPYIEFNLLHKAQDNITSICTGTLSVEKKYDNIYYATEKGEINILFYFETSMEERKTIEELYKKAIEKNIFEITKHTLIDFDILEEYCRKKNIKHSFIERIRNIH
ncbi:hypothetical protein SLOPH_1719 [Spraguea lophii 42_110]|uniref:RSE1/DDB1/CPSF1 C-terminal domain-containing protein n=1 Tax=Spraguea lophii (strain 42_110) TaxID=1358809 RepID=S7WBJ0_SPRLO|nr:hypothetical protein SLOPH_1719 [Spraguea lophii 42_110]